MKKTILLICGGQSAEHEVSVRSGKSIYDALDKEQYEVVVVGIQRDGIWKYFADQDLDDLFANSNVDQSSNDNNTVLLAHDNSNQLLINRMGSYMPLFNIDCIFPVLHGPHGEDGTIQGLFEIANIPYVGCDVTSSAICMDKIILKDIFYKYGIQQANYISILNTDANPIEKIEQHIDYPIFVKPANMGSSVGISKVNNETELNRALNLAFKYDFKVVVEQSLENMHEVECSVLGNPDNPKVSPIVGEIIAGHAFYDYETKYIDNESELVIPTKLNEEIIDKIRNIALKAYSCAGCSGLSRIDMFVDKNDNNNIYVNEINTMPGFTSISMYPMLWEAADLSFESLVSELINHAESLFEAKQTLSTDM